MDELAYFIEAIHGAIGMKLQPGDRFEYRVVGDPRGDYLVNWMAYAEYRRPPAIDDELQRARIEPLPQEMELDHCNLMEVLAVLRRYIPGIDDAPDLYITRMVVELAGDPIIRADIALLLQDRSP